MNITRIIEKLVDIRSGEYQKTGLMFLYILFLITSYVMIKAVRDALFLNKLGSSQLPYVYILVGVIVGVVAWIYARLSARVSLHVLIHSTLLVVVANLLLFWWLLQFGWSWLYYALYFWSSGVGILTTAQYWLLANYVFNAREAKRLFGVIGAGAIAGGIAGGVLTARAVTFVGTEALLVLSGVGYLLCGGVVGLLGRHTMPPVPPAEHVHEMSLVAQEPHSHQTSILGTLRTSRHLFTIVGLIGLVEIVETLVDYQFKVMAAESFRSKDALTAFMGTFSAWLSASSFLLQLLLTGRVLSKLGIALTLLFLPVSLLIGSLAILAVPGLISASITKLSEGGFRYSINKAGLELLYLPIPLGVKNRVKPFIDTVVDRVARGIGGLILLVTIGMLTVAQVSLITIALLSIWILLAVASQKEYLKSLQAALQRRQMDLTVPVLNLSEPRTVELLTRELLESQDTSTLYVLRLLERADITPYLPALQALMRREPPGIRSAAVRLLAETRNRDLLPDLEPLIQDQDLETRVEAMRFVCAVRGCPDALIEEWLASDDPRIVGGAIVCALSYHDKDLQTKGDRLLRSMIGTPEPQRTAHRLEAAKTLGWIPPTSVETDALSSLLTDEAADVVGAALKSAGATQRAEVVPQILPLLLRKDLRGDAKATLVCYGPKIVPFLGRCLEQDGEALALRRALPRVIAEIGGADAVQILLRNLDQPDRLLRYQALKGLNKLRRRDPALQVDPSLIEARLKKEIRFQYELLFLAHDPVLAAERPGVRLLKRALQERLDDNLKMVFRLLGLRFPPRDIHNAYYAVIAEEAPLRANGLEFLDTLLPSPLKQWLLPILEPRSPGPVLEAGQRFFSLPWPGYEPMLDHLLDGTDSWLKTCALYAIADLQLVALLPRLRQALSDPEALVRETARFALTHLADASELRLRSG